jgi:hypothetical protein
MTWELQLTTVTELQDRNDCIARLALSYCADTHIYIPLYALDASGIIVTLYLKTDWIMSGSSLPTVLSIARRKAPHVVGLEDGEWRCIVWMDAGRTPWWWVSVCVSLSHRLKHCCVYIRSYDIINDIMQTLSSCPHMCGWEHVARTELRDPSLLAPVQCGRATTS